MCGWPNDFVMTRQADLCFLCTWVRLGLKKKHAVCRNKGQSRYVGPRHVCLRHLICIQFIEDDY